MKTKKIWFLFLLLLPFTVVRADEGMWFLMHIDRLNHRDMQKMGLQLTSDEIYSINHSSLKDAIVQFGGGCTAEIVSKDGLVLTNHHCGYGAIAELSTPEHDYLTNGFWARSKQDELKPKSLSVRFFVRMDDVSKRILSKVNDQMSEFEREQVINREIAHIEQENSEGGKYVVSVKSFYNGNEYYYFVYQDYNDVRLVGTPPNSIGKFGGDTDNWEWPRHTGDFSLFRVYADREGNPAEYNENNVPLKPKYHLPVSLKGFQENDFAMILGYPGRTNRWMPAAGIDQNVNFAYPAWVEASKVGMDNMKKHMDQNQQVKLEYASKYAQVANYWKNRQGMIDALSKHQTAATKRAEESKFNQWANKKDNKARFGKVIETINRYYELTNEKSRHDNYMMGMLRSSNFASLPYVLGRALLIYADGTDAKKAELKSSLKTEIASQYEKLYLPLEQDVLAAELNLYASKAKAGGLAPRVDSLSRANGGTFNNYIKQAFESSIFSSEEKLLTFLTNPQAEQIEQDPLFLLSSDLMTRYRYTDEEQKKEEANFQRAFRLMVEGMRKANPKKIYYPDANSTLRLTYGKITALPADPRNDAKENFYTTLKGTIAKYKPKDEEFDLPQRLIDLYKTKDFGRYADRAGYMPVNFLTNNDITGGNSGSPVINGKGELIGIAFDGNIEAMAGDVIFDQQLQRTIAVDIRYVLFIMDKFAGAKHLVDEMTLAE
ncbi:MULTISPECIES: S46 family peptidase [Olivibacter]|uniref:Dipeptidyl-peptidase n=1 Tax=Olivibacter oleidegradans TaxID=760123 RepID=A0ABV6HFQ6_9SPHI|nr:MULTISPECIES: S46 family peptidase [Olivibacter]QEL00191.1 S46 family peptidase [Olivibacter sp. LS-1]